MFPPAPWPFRTLWLVLPVLAGPAVADALADRSRAVQVVASLLAWAIWGTTLVAALVPRTVTLTVVRLAAPGAVVVAAWASVGAERPTWAGAGVVTAVLCLLTALTPATADAFVDGSSYGDERRVSLRAPFSLVAGPVPLAWVLLAGGMVTGPLLLAAQRWVPGAVATAVGPPIAALLGTRLHLLSRRWLVFVPAGVVVHDPLTLSEPVLFPRRLVRHLGPAPAESDALDVTGGALGLALELRAAAPVTVGVREGRRTSETGDVSGVLVTPGRPATTLELARQHRLPMA